MPDIAALQAEIGGDDFTVLTVASSNRDTQAKVGAFFEKQGITQLPRMIDETERLPRALGGSRPARLVPDRPSGADRGAALGPGRLVEPGSESRDRRAARRVISANRRA
ncbi:hypothetical protein ACTTAL_16385 [Rhodobacter capsulatus]|uniref:hypothetical protein n=1 Tax=Rhodobacter capsulatus TaxID=1061 RepID=UPI004038E4E7